MSILGIIGVIIGSSVMLVWAVITFFMIVNNIADWQKKRRKQ